MVSAEATREAVRRLEQTRTQLRKDLDNHQLAIIFGNGVTLNVTAQESGEPLSRITWEGLLRNGLDYLVQKGCVKEWDRSIRRAYDALEDIDFDGKLEAANTLRYKMKKTEQFPSWLESVFADLSQEIRYPALLDVLKTLHENGVPLLTINYDDVLEKYCRLDGIGRSDQDQISRFLRRDIYGVLHIHGIWTHANEVVLDTRDYYEVRQSVDLQDMLKDFLRTKTILFVGCGSGLEDPNFEALLRWATDQRKNISNRHCLLIRDDDSTNYSPLKGLTYGPTHEHLAPFLRRLLADETMQSVAPSIGFNSTILPDPLLVLPFASNTDYENMLTGSLNWNSQQYSSSQAATQSWTGGEDSAYYVNDLYDCFGVKEKAPLFPVAKYTLAAYPDTTDSCQDHELSANCPSILSIEDAKTKLQSELGNHWTHLQDKKAKRRAQNRINKQRSRWKEKFYLETAEDYHMLAHEIQNERKGLRLQREGRRKTP